MAHDHEHLHSPLPEPGGEAYTERLDPANQSLADALRKSFGLLKLIMLVLAVLYCFSGFFRVSANEVGIRWRYGRIVGADQYAANAVLGPGWNWSWPYPFERCTTYSTSERQIPVEFLFQLSDEERTQGIKGMRYDVLSPLRDDYLITGDVNIIHASVIVKYKLNNASDDNVVHYLRNVSPQPSPRAGPRAAEPSYNYPEYTLMTSLVRDAVIEVAARGEALKIRGADQQKFLSAVAERVSTKLKEYKEAGTPLGLYVDPEQGIIGKKTGEVEPIMPPRQTQEVFDQVQSAGEQKSGAITKANAEAQALLVNTAGPAFQTLSEAIDAEFKLMETLSAAESAAAGRNSPELAKLQEEARISREATERLLTSATGAVRGTLRNAEIARDQIIKEAAGDYQRFLAVLPEYQHDPTIFLTRLLSETYANALGSEKIAKIFLPPAEWRLSIPRTGKPVVETREEIEKKKREAANRLPFKPTPMMQ